MASRATAKYTEERTRAVAAPAPVLWQVVEGIGGDQGWHAADRLWRLRAAADRLIGGPGMRGRREGTPEPDDALDFWRVEEVDAPYSMRLRAEMKMPGTAWLELAVDEPGAGRSLLVQRTWFAPAGVLGHAFWWAELPAHKVVFARMCDGIARAAEERTA
jgi:hypothetical protein